ncbi:MAG: hypothetical protein ABI406_09560 [Ktedonobacteraceae bacterium]
MLKMVLATFIHQHSRVYQAFWIALDESNGINLLDEDDENGLFVFNGP